MSIQQILDCYAVKHKDIKIHRKIEINDMIREYQKEYQKEYRKLLKKYK